MGKDVKENKFMIMKIMPVSILNEKFSKEDNAIVKYYEERKQNALDFFSKEIISQLANSSYPGYCHIIAGNYALLNKNICGERYYEGFYLDDALWALRELAKAYEEEGYSVDLKDDYSSSYHIKARLTIFRKRV